MRGRAVVLKLARSNCLSANAEAQTLAGHRQHPLSGYTNQHGLLGAQARQLNTMRMRFMRRERDGGRRETGCSLEAFR